MREQVTQATPDKENEAGSVEDQSTTSRKKTSWIPLLSRKWVVIIIGLSIVIHGIGFAYYHYAKKCSPGVPSPEVSLGVFTFEADENERGRVKSAKFSVCIALLEQVDQAARYRLTTHKFRVQQEIEELLRQAHGGDFDDPTLGELKRQLQERVNETLGMRAIADVIITDLKLQYSNQDIQAVTNTAETVPWAENPSG